MASMPSNNKMYGETSAASKKKIAAFDAKNPSNKPLDPKLGYLGGGALDKFNPKNKSARAAANTPAAKKPTIATDGLKSAAPKSASSPKNADKGAAVGKMSAKGMPKKNVESVASAKKTAKSVPDAAPQGKKQRGLFGSLFKGGVFKKHKAKKK